MAEVTKSLSPLLQSHWQLWCFGQSLCEARCPQKTDECHLNQPSIPRQRTACHSHLTGSHHEFTLLPEVEPQVGRAWTYLSMNCIHFATPDVTFRTSYTWNIHRYTLEKPAVIRLTEPSAGSFALEVLVAGEPDDYFVFYEKVCAEWDCIRMVETLTFAWSLNSSSSIRYELTFKDGADFWCFLWHLTKPLPHN
ncbi:hypothetical protein EDB92DRAFT_1627340 [Lactarius akahatsu]|uniref:Uncharacterized protein n=1 Tax=Lactarius akahatsu TaxID=416441 RepID=A0AAD4Q9C8_9AGAM|nr:hypothetical protein EDB92DRAFT_1627340 [Lactarius akahatsu]